MSNRISLYIAADAELQAVRGLAKRELATSRNVKSDWTKREVSIAWRNILVHLNGLKKIPSNGLILFASSDGVEVIDPPIPNRSNIYRCGSNFYREPLEAMQDEAAGEKYGMILIDNAEATLAWWRGSTIVPLWHDYSHAMSKHRAGGQSSQRFERGHEEEQKQWMRKVSDIANQVFLPMDVTKVLVAGPGFRKRELVEDAQLDYRIQILAIVDAEYVDDVAGPREALARWKQSRQDV